MPAKVEHSRIHPIWLLTCDSIRDRAGDRQLEQFMLERLDHQQYPENKSGNSHADGEYSEGAVADEPAGHPAHEDEPDPNYGESAKNNNGLRGMKLHKRPLVDQQKNDPREPAEYVAQ